MLKTNKILYLVLFILCLGLVGSVQALSKKSSIIKSLSAKTPTESLANSYLKSDELIDHIKNKLNYSSDSSDFVRVVSHLTASDPKDSSPRDYRLSSSLLSLYEIASNSSGTASRNIRPDELSDHLGKISIDVDSKRKDLNSYYFVEFRSSSQSVYDFCDYTIEYNGKTIGTAPMPLGSTPDTIRELVLFSDPVKLASVGTHDFEIHSKGTLTSDGQIECDSYFTRVVVYRARLRR